MSKAVMNVMIIVIQNRFPPDPATAGPPTPAALCCIASHLPLQGARLDSRVYPPMRGTLRQSRAIHNETFGVLGNCVTALRGRIRDAEVPDAGRSV